MSAPLAATVRVDEVLTVSAYDWGGDGPTAVFCHATGFHGRVWDPIIAELRDTFRCVAVDLRGHGDSEYADDYVFQGEDTRHDVVAVIDALGLGTGLFGVGHSLGGGTVALAELMRPGTFTAAWLCEPILIPDPVPDYQNSDGSRLVESARRRREVFASHDEAFERYTSRRPFSGCDPAMVRAYVDHGFRRLPDGTVRLKCRGEVEATMFEHPTVVAYERLASLAGDFTIMGSGDGGPPAQIAALATDAMPNATFQFEAEMTHFAPFEDPRWAAESIRAAASGYLAAG